MVSNKNFIAKIEETKDGIPYIDASLLVRDRKISVKLVIDTGSSYSLIVDEDKRKSAFYNIIINEKINDSIFVVDKYSFPVLNGTKLNGILGSDFFLRHHLVLDFEHLAILNSSTCCEKKMMNVFYPLHVGLNKYKIPIVGLIKGENSFCCAVDSGSCANIMSRQSFDGNFIHELLYKRVSLMGCLCMDTANIAPINFQIVCMTSTRETGISLPFKDLFLILKENSELLRVFGKRDIDVIIGYPFLKRHKWIFDYANDLMYSPKL